MEERQKKPWCFLLRNCDRCRKVQITTRQKAKHKKVTRKREIKAGKGEKGRTRKGRKVERKERFADILCKAGYMLVAHLSGKSTSVDNLRRRPEVS